MSQFSGQRKPHIFLNQLHFLQLVEAKHLSFAMLIWCQVPNQDFGAAAAGIFIEDHADS